MAKLNSEEYREDIAHPIENVDSSASAVEQGPAGEHRVGDQREPPSSRVGYGGGNDRYHKNQGYWEDTNRGDNEKESQHGKDSSTVEQGLAGEQDLDLIRLHEPPSSCVGYGGGDDRYHENQGYWEDTNRGDNEKESQHGTDSSTVEQGLAGEQDLDLTRLREPPSSCVGYGGGDDRYHETPNQGHWEDRHRGDYEEESQYGKDVRASDSSSTVQQRGGISSVGTVNPDSRPSEVGFVSSGPGGYPDEGDYNLDSFGNASSKQSGIYGKGGTSEVRNGVRHGVTDDGIASGAGAADDIGGSNPTSTDIEQHQYHMTEVAPSQQKDTPYSQMFTEPDGPSEGRRDRFLEEEDVTGNTKGGTAVDHHEASQGADHPESKGFLRRLMHKLPGQQ